MTGNGGTVRRLVGDRLDRRERRGGQLRPYGQYLLQMPVGLVEQVIAARIGIGADTMMSLPMQCSVDKVEIGILSGIDETQY